MSEKDQPRRDDQCIERRSFGDSLHFYSVREYEADRRRGEGLGLRAQGFWGLGWTRDAPEIEDLTEDVRETSEGWFRICDPESYDRQMREFVGLA